jgi:hypothetical protein
MVSRISLMPNRPMTATRKFTPRRSGSRPKVMRSLPDTVSMPTAASKSPSAIEMMTLCLFSLPSPTNEQNVRRYTAKNSGGPKRRANDEIIGARNVISSTATSEPMNDEVNAAVSASAALPLLGHRVAVERRRDRPRLAGNVEQDRRDRASEQRAPVDARQHHDRGRRVHREGERQQDRHAVRSAEAGQHAHEDAEQEPQQHQRQDLPRQQDGEALHQERERFH